MLVLYPLANVLTSTGKYPSDCLLLSLIHLLYASTTAFKAIPCLFVLENPEANTNFPSSVWSNP